MARLTVDFGIDLGTTNSVAAVYEGDKVTLIPNREGAVTTPSAVHIDRRGRLHVGAGARAHDEEENTALRFKRTMGLGKEAAKHFANGDRRLLPEELSAEVLKQLRADIRDKRGEEPREIVVTIPADFGAGPSAATKEAARLAGFAECTLLQEPIAAALAYGVDKLEENAYWLVYDFGGGTFDAAIIRLEEGLPIVVNHAGNNQLGGSEIDHAIAEQKLVPALLQGRRLPDFDTDPVFWKTPFAKLRREAERAKIEVCRTKRPFLVVIDEICQDEKGRPVDFEHELTPEDVAEITAPFLADTLALCRKALDEKGMKPEQIDRVLMVGGSSLSPWVRQGVEAELGRPLEIGIDPMTVVAEGAAIFASTLNAKIRPDEAESGTYALGVISGLTVDESPLDLAGRVTAPEGGSLDGVTLELIDEAGGRRSGRIPLGADGGFKTTQEINEGRGTVFRLELRAADGTLLPCSHETLTVRWGAGGDVAIPLTQSIGVGLASGPLQVILRRGIPLEARGRADLRTVQPLRRGDKAPLRIPMYQGTNEGRAVRNRLLGALLVQGDQISRDIPANAEVEVEMICDRSNTLTARAFFPATEDEVEMGIELDKSMPPAKTLQASLEEQEARLEKLRGAASSAPSSRVEAALREIESRDLQRRIRSALRDPKDMEARAEAERLVRDFAEQVDAVADALELPRLVAEAQDALERCRESVERHGSESHRRRLATLERGLEEAVASGSPIRIEGRRRDIVSLIAELHENDPEVWVGAFFYLRDDRGSMSDQRTAAELIRHGEAALEANDLERLKAIVRQMLGLMPPERRDVGAIVPDSGVDKGF